MSWSNWLRKMLIGTIDVPSPSDIVPKANIIHWEIKNNVEINLNELNIPFTKPPKVWIPEVPDTNSMDPGFDFGHNNILVAGIDEKNQKVMVDFLKVGDIAVAQSDKFYFIHRIVEIGIDSEGRYFRFKGDNNYAQDPYKVRDTHIKWLAIGTIF